MRGRTVPLLLVGVCACAGGRNASSPGDAGTAGDAGDAAVGPDASAPFEPCNGIDDDADPRTPDGSGDDRHHAACEAPKDSCGGWEWQCTEGEWICGQRFGAISESTRLTEAVLPPTLGDEGSASIVWDGEGYTVAFNRWEEDATRLYAMRVDVHGARVAGPTVVAADDHDRFYQVAVAPAADSGALAAWSVGDVWDTETEDLVRVAPLAADGTAGPAVDVASGVDVGSLAVASSDAGFLVAFLSKENPEPLEGIFTVRAVVLGPDGAATGEPVPLGTTPMDASFAGREIAVTATTNGWAVGWRSPWGARVRFLDADATPTGPEIDVSDGNPANSVDVAWEGDRLGVSWRDFGDEAIRLRLYAERGVALSDAIDVSGEVPGVQANAMASLDHAFGVVWQGAGEGQNDGVRLAVVADDGDTLCWSDALSCSLDDSHFWMMAGEDVAYGDGHAAILFKAGATDVEWDTGYLWFLEVMISDCGPF